MTKLSIITAFYVIATACVVVSFPIVKIMVDMSHPFDNDTIYFPGYSPFQLEAKTLDIGDEHDDRYLVRFEEFTSGTHMGTHMDAPIHFLKNSWTLDDIPMDRLLKVPASVIDVTEEAKENPDYQVTIEDLLHWEEQTKQDLNCSVVLIRTGYGNYWPNRESYTGTAELDVSKLHFPGFSGEAAQWLVDHRKIYGVGIDTLSFDTGNSANFPAHKILLAAHIYGLENVANMDQLPIFGAMLHILPMKIPGASGAATRIIATYPKVVFQK